MSLCSGVSGLLLHPLVLDSHVWSHLHSPKADRPHSDQMESKTFSKQTHILSDYKVTVHRPVSPPHFCVAVAQFKMDAQTVFPHRCDGPDLRYASAGLRLTSGRTVRHIWWMLVSLAGLRHFMWGKAVKAKRLCALFPHSVAEQCHVLGWRAVRRLSGWSTCMRALRRTEVWWWEMSWLRRMETFAGVTVLKVRLYMAQMVPVRTAELTAHGRESQLGRRVGTWPMPYRWVHTHTHRCITHVLWAHFQFSAKLMYSWPQVLYTQHSTRGFTKTELHSHVFAHGVVFASDSENELCRPDYKLSCQKS